MHILREKQSLAIHRRVVALLVERPDAVIDKALDNLQRWTAQSDAAEVPAVYQEWRKLLTNRDPQEIAEILLSDEENAVRLRQSTPFAGVLGAREIWKIKRCHETA